MECDAAFVVGSGTSFVGCDGLDAAGTTEISCSGDGVPKARYSRVCTCKSRTFCDTNPSLHSLGIMLQTPVALFTSCGFWALEKVRSLFMLAVSLSCCFFRR